MLLELDLDIDAARRVQPHQRVDRLRAGVDDVDQTLVRPHLEMLHRLLVDVRTADDAEDILLRRERHRPGDPGARAARRLDDLTGRLVDDLVVERLQAYSDLVSPHAGPSPNAERGSLR